jgi:HD-like signal output (HDOD) protein
MNNRIIKNLSNLPTLSTTLKEVQKLKAQPEVGAKEIAKVIEKDPMETMNILKTVNKPIYNIGNEVKNLQQAIAIFGITKTFGILLDNNIKQLMHKNMEPYNTTPDEFAHLSVMQSALAKKWCELQGIKSTDKIFLASLIQEVGKIIISDMIKEDGEEENFKMDIMTASNIEEIEEAYLNMSTIEVTTLILSKWEIDYDIKEIINNSSNPKKANPKYQREAAILNVIRTAIPINKPLSEQAIKLAKKKAEMYGLDAKSLEEAIEYVKSYI